MKNASLILIVGLCFVLKPAFGDETKSDANAKSSSDHRRLNNMVTELLTAHDVFPKSRQYDFHRSTAGWILISADHLRGKLTLKLDDQPKPLAVSVSYGNGAGLSYARDEAFQFVAAGRHSLFVESDRSVRMYNLSIKAVPELMHCGLGFDPAIRSYGKYDLAFLKKDILPNVTTLIVPGGIKLDQAVIDDWHRQGKRFVGSASVSHEAKTADEHVQYWASYFDKSPFLDGIIIDEFIINLPFVEWGVPQTEERLQRFARERLMHPIYEEAFRKLRSDDRYKGKTIDSYIGGSGKKLNQEIVGPTFIHSILDCGYRIALERYIFEVSSQQKSDEALQQFVDGIADWVAKEPSVIPQMVMTFGLFSMPPGGINKQPNVDYHVWMDQQMKIVANHPLMVDIGGLNWWTSLQADEETVRFVGKLYRHYAIEGNTELLTRDPLFLSHLQNTDFEKELEGWTLHAAEEGSIQAKSFPRYGRIEGRYMGLGKPPDPEHIGDTFLWMKRSSKAANTFSQEIKNLQPGRLYSLKMFSCDYQDLVNPKQKTREEAQPFIGNVGLEGVIISEKKSFREIYASSPEPPIPVWITYHWFVFRVTEETAKLTVSDWPTDQNPTEFGQEQTFNFLELEPYHE